MVREEKQRFQEMNDSAKEDSSSSSSSSTVIDLMEEDASSSPSAAAFELSELMANLPIKRGLSKYYEGKSESFKSFGSLKSSGELAKKSYQKRMRVRRRQLFRSPRPTIAKKPILRCKTKPIG